MFERNVFVKENYLNLPVRNGAPKRVIELVAENKVVRSFTIEIASMDKEKVDLWVSTDISAFRGMDMAIRMPNPSGAGSEILDAVYQSECFLEDEGLYQEEYRPGFHFTTRKGWINDPNGLIYYKGEYHLFYQHNPFGIGWGNMNWGHAVSIDLVHWKELPVAICPDELGMIYSGSTIIDKSDCSGLFDGKEGMIAYFTHAHGPRGQVQSFAYSKDDGRTWEKYSGNPVLTSENEPDNSFRDPRIMWHEKTKKWIMAVYKAIDGKSSAVFYASDDLKSWQFLSFIPGIHECPDLFELEIDGEKNNKKWILLGVQGTYMLGDFDGINFVAETGMIRFENGTHFSATQTFANMPNEYERRIQLAWMRFGMYPDMPFNQQLTFPCELTLRNTPHGVRMFRNPAREIEALREKSYQWSNVRIQPGKNILEGIEGDLFDIEMEINVQDTDKIGLLIKDESIRYNTVDKYLKCFGKTIKTNFPDNIVKLRILVDITSVEIFVNNGEYTFSACYIPDRMSKSLSLYTEGGTALIQKLNIWELKPIWNI